MQFSHYASDTQPASQYEVHTKADCYLVYTVGIDVAVMSQNFRHVPVRLSTITTDLRERRLFK